MIHTKTEAARTGKRIPFLLLMTVFVGCGAEQPSPVALEEAEGPFTWGSAGNVMQVGRLWISEQPDEAGLAAAKDAGVTLVLDLRAPGEREWEESAAATRVGLGYRNIVVPKEEPFAEEAFSEIEAFVKAHPDDEILLHCSSGNRAAGWLTTHLVQIHGMSFSEALAIGRRAGITKPEIVEKTSDYLGEEPSDDRDVPRSGNETPPPEPT